MRLPFLSHLLDSVRALVRPRRIIVLGSSSLLPRCPELGGPGNPLELSLDADFLLEPVDQKIADLLKEAVGSDSVFQQHHGYYADILHPDIVETLPAGWESRLHPVPGYDNVFALDLYDLALVKLIVGRPKDLELLRALRGLGLLDIVRLRQHYQATPLGEREAIVAGRNLTALNSQPSTPRSALPPP